MGKKPPTGPEFRRIVEGLCLASPIGLASHFDDGIAHCMEMSIAGARALRRFHIDARPLPCAIIGQHDAFHKFAVGLTAREIYDREGVVELFDDWVKASQFPDDDALNTHMVIEARAGGQRALIDLTYGQLREGHGLDVPIHLVHWGEGWPTVQGDGWTLEFIASLRAEHVIEATRHYEGRGLGGDLYDLTRVALHCDNRPQSFVRFLIRQQPALFGAILPRLEAFGRMALAG